ncbi:MAG TPA: ABC transporter substrate-binding protein [Methylomirabilota bacterium]|nr:ABC transporter substrate-binding protein [Methylomirabilota bacterium]
MKIIWALLASALLSGIFFAAPTNAAEPRKMIVPYTPLTGASIPFWIAIEGRLFQKYGLEIAPLFISAGSSAIVPAMTAGQFDVGAVGGGAVVLNRFGGGDLITIGAQTGAYTIDCFSKPEIKAIGDLKGRTISVTRFGTSTHFAALSMLRLGGLKPADVVFIQIGGSSEAIAALLSGRVDAAMLGYPVSEVALKRGFHKLTDLANGEDGAFPTTAIAARESWLKDPKNREVALNFLRGFTDGLILARTDAAMSKKVLRKYTRVEDEAVLQATFEYYKKYFGDTLKVNERSYANLLQLLDHPKAKDADPKRFFDNSLLEQIRR